MSLASYGPEEFGPFQSVARRDQESIAQDLYLFGARYTARKACPEGATGLSPGFQPWEPQKKLLRPEGATGYQMSLVSIVAQNESARLQSAPIGPYFRVVSKFDLAPLQGASLMGGRFPGLKPWAKSCCPFGAGPSLTFIAPSETTRRAIKSF
jgi:hypothetical protein